MFTHQGDIVLVPFLSGGVSSWLVACFSNMKLPTTIYAFPSSRLDDYFMIISLEVDLETVTAAEGSSIL